MIDARKLARIRRLVGEDYLLGLGYRSSSPKEYVGKAGAQLRYVSFGRAATIGGPDRRRVFDVSIALHFDFLPSFAFAAWPGAAVPLSMCAEVCAFSRLVRNQSGGQYYEYGHLTEAEATSVLRDVAARAAAGLAEIGATCGDGQPLLGLISPRTLADDLEVFRQLLRASTIEEQAHLSDSMQIRRVLPEWHPHIAPTAILLGYLARHYRRPTLVPEYMAVAREAGIEQRHIPYVNDLEVTLRPE